MSCKKALLSIACMVFSVTLFLVLAGTCLGSDIFQKTPVKDVPISPDSSLSGQGSYSEGGSMGGGLSGNGFSVGNSSSWESSGQVSLSTPGMPRSGAPQLPIPPSETGIEPPSLPLPGAPSSAPDLADLLNTGTLAGLLDPSNIPSLLPRAANPPSPGTLPGLLDPSAFPELQDLPGVDGIISGFPTPPTSPGMPPFPPSGFQPEDLIKIVEEPDRILVLVSLDDLLEARVTLGKNLEKASLLALHITLFKALAAEGSLGLRRVNDDAFLVPLDFYLRYWAGDQGWQEIFNLLLPLEISFPGAGMLPKGVQDLIDNIYRYILKPLLPLLPIYHPEEPPAVEPPGEEHIPQVEVGGELVTNPQRGESGLGDHLPLTGADMAFLLGLIMALSTAGFLISRLERKFKKNARRF